MAEDLALAEQVDDAAVVEQLDRAPADDPYLDGRSLPLRHDCGPGGEELHLGVRGEPLE